jgi:two-component system, sensor histidine kinase and response regulator
MERAKANTVVQLPPQKILVIDDEDDYRAMIRVTLKMIGYDVIEASNGLDGLAAARMHHPDLVLCDVKMPEMDGYTLLGRLKEDPACAAIPFIFLTGNAAKSDMRQGMQLGADDYLTKPFTSDELITAIKTRLVRKKSLQKYYELQFDDIKTSFVRSLPHEFRTPLHAILGYAQILQEESGLPAEEVKEIGAFIDKSGRRLHHLLENMILFGELQFWMNDQKTIATMRRESMTSLREVIRSAAEQEASIQKRADAMDITVKDSVAQISSMHLTKIMEEVIGNALKFSEPGSKIHISSKEDDAEILIIIRDEGRGMSQEQISKVTAFQQFERRLHEQQGAGLGLVIAKTLTELYGGSLTIESTEKIGTTVTIKLLKAKDERPPVSLPLTN